MTSSQARRAYIHAVRESTKEEAALLLEEYIKANKIITDREYSEALRIGRMTSDQ